MTEIIHHRDLKVWQLAMELVVKIYQSTQSFPRDEIYGLSSQMRRASVSIPSNIAEGAARKSTKEYIQFLYIALGSSSELETQIEIAKRLNYIEDITVLIGLNNQIRYCLVSLISTLGRKSTVRR